MPVSLEATTGQHLGDRTEQQDRVAIIPSKKLKGTALEYLSNVLPPDVFPRVRSCFGASTAPLPRAARPLQQVADELRASSVGLRIEQPPWREGGEG